MEYSPFKDRRIAQITRKPLTPQQKTILTTLIENGGSAKMDDLVEAVWPDPDKSPETEWNTIKVQICKLRKKLAPPAHIKSAWAREYYLMGVEGLEPTFPEYLAERPTTSEANLLDTLSDGKVHSRYALEMGLYQWRDPPGDENIISVFLSNVRKKLAPGWRIQAVYGKGYQLVKT